MTEIDLKLISETCCAKLRIFGNNLDYTNQKMKILDTEIGGIISWILKLNEQILLKKEINEIMCEIEKLNQEKIKFDGWIVYKNAEKANLKEQIEILNKFESFVKENISLLKDIPSNSENDINKISVIFNRCKIANMVANTNSICSSSSISDDDYELPVLVNENTKELISSAMVPENIYTIQNNHHELNPFSRIETEGSSNITMRKKKTLRLGKKLACVRSHVVETENDIPDEHELAGIMAFVGDNDLPYESKDKITLNDDKQDLQITCEKPKDSSRNIKIQEKPTDYTEKQESTQQKSNENLTREIGPIKPVKMKKEKSYCMNCCS